MKGDKPPVLHFDVFNVEVWSLNFAFSQFLGCIIELNIFLSIDFNLVKFPCHFINL